jgi:ABC-type nickel/cobalt efflux system permease component RcnA
MMLVAILSAFVLGAGHALIPGHGKTIVSAYLVGSRGTLRHAAFLGAMVTFTHTIVVFVLGIAVLFLFRYVVPEQVTVWLGAVSGLSIVAVGAWMFYKRLRHARAQAHHHDHHHHGHSHSHSHVPDELSWGGLAALGASGGLVPCESALVLLLGAIALGRTGFGLLLLVSFSLGLAVVLIAIGAVVRKESPARAKGGRVSLLSLGGSRVAGGSHDCRTSNDGRVAWMDSAQVGDLMFARNSGQRRSEVLLQNQDHGAANTRGGAIASGKQ